MRRESLARTSGRRDSPQRLSTRQSKAPRQEALTSRACVHVTSGHASANGMLSAMVASCHSLKSLTQLVSAWRSGSIRECTKLRSACSSSAPSNVNSRGPRAARRQRASDQAAATLSVATGGQPLKNASSETSSTSGAPRRAVSADTEEFSEAEPVTARSCVKYTFSRLAARLASAAALLASRAAARSSAAALLASATALLASRAALLASRAAARSSAAALLASRAAALASAAASASLSCLSSSMRNTRSKCDNSAARQALKHGARGR